MEEQVLEKADREIEEMDYSQPISDMEQNLLMGLTGCDMSADLPENLVLGVEAIKGEVWRRGGGTLLNRRQLLLAALAVHDDIVGSLKYFRRGEMVDFKFDKYYQERANAILDEMLKEIDEKRPPSLEDYTLKRDPKKKEEPKQVEVNWYRKAIKARLFEVNDGKALVVFDGESKERWVNADKIKGL